MSISDKGIIENCQGGMWLGINLDSSGCTLL